MQLLRELQSVFESKEWVLSAAVSSVKEKIDAGYDVPKIAQVVDFLNVMTYFMHGHWDGYVDHHAPLFPREGESEDAMHLNAVIELNYYINTAKL